MITIEKLPGPSDYRPYHDEQVPGGTFGTSSKKPTAYPDCLNYRPHLRSTKGTPGAASYNPNNHCIANNSSTRKSMGMRVKSKKFKGM